MTIPPNHPRVLSQLRPTTSPQSHCQLPLCRQGLFQRRIATMASLMVAYPTRICPIRHARSNSICFLLCPATSLQMPLLLSTMLVIPSAHLQRHSTYTPVRLKSRHSHLSIGLAYSPIMLRDRHW